jgi:hypothetical protein
MQEKTGFFYPLNFKAGFVRQSSRSVHHYARFGLLIRREHPAVPVNLRAGGTAQRVEVIRCEKDVLLEKSETWLRLRNMIGSEHR